MNRSNHAQQYAGTLSRTLLIVVMVFAANLLSGCGGGIFGTSSSSDEIAATDAADGPNTMAPTGDIAPGPDATPEPDTDSPATDPVAPESPASSGSDIQPLSIDFSNTTPSGIDPSSPAVPALKLINLTDATLSVSTVEQSASAPPQGTSDLLAVNTGESQVDIRIQDTDIILASITPLNAASDSITTIVIAGDANITRPQVAISALTVDTRAVASTNSMADVRVLSTQAANTSDAPISYTLSPAENSTGGAELELMNANENNPGTGVYELANAGSYLLSSSDSSFTPEPITLLADTVYTIIITGNSQSPVYVEQDSF